jgi:hypothetical protein
MVGAAAAYLKLIIGGSDDRKEYVMTWLNSLSGAGVGEPLGIRRAVLSVFSNSKHDMETIFESSLRQFGDQLYIRHAPTIHQEGKTNIFSLPSHRLTSHRSLRSNSALVRRLLAQNYTFEAFNGSKIIKLSQCRI